MNNGATTQKSTPTFEEVMELYYAKMLGLARAIAGESIAEEVVQEASLSIYRSLDQLRNPESLKSWVLRIVANEAKTRIRKEKKRHQLEIGSGYDSLTAKDAYDGLMAQGFDESGCWQKPLTSWPEANPEELLMEDQLQHCFMACLKVLPGQQRAVFMLKDMEGQSLKDICNILDVSDSNVRVLLHRARYQLLKSIQHYQETGKCEAADKSLSKPVTI